MPSLIDVDVHLETPRVETLYPYLEEHWIEHFENSLDYGPVQQYYPPRSPVSVRRDEAGERVGTSLEALRCLFDETDVEIAVSSCLYAVDGIHNPDVAAALARAVNRWQAEEFLARESRLRGSIVVPLQVTAAAVTEVERAASYDGMVQVLIPARTLHPLGSRHYHPLWEAIEKSGLVAAVHFGGAPVQPPTPTGWPSFFLEEYTAMAQVFATQLTSLVVEGVFDAYPDLRVVFLESGFTWLPAHLWRMDKEWRNLRRLVPWVRRPPSEYVREHVRLAVQPLDAPPEPAQLVEVVEQLGSDDLLLFASDYPHRHLFDVEKSLLSHLPQDLRTKIRSTNARDFYRF